MIDSSTLAVDPRFPRSSRSPLSDGVDLDGLGVPGAHPARSFSSLASVRYPSNPKRLVGQVLPLAPELLVDHAGTTASDPAQNTQEMLLRKVERGLFGR